MDRPVLLRRRRLGIRARLTLFYALGALLLASMMASSAYLLAQGQLLNESEQTARSQFYRNTRDLRRSLAALPEIPPEISSEIIDPIDEVDTTTTTQRPTTTRPTVSSTSLPASVDPLVGVDDLGAEVDGLDPNDEAATGDPTTAGDDPTGAASISDPNDDALADTEAQTTEVTVPPTADGDTDTAVPHDGATPPPAGSQPPQTDSLPSPDSASTTSDSEEPIDPNGGSVGELTPTTDPFANVLPQEWYLYRRQALESVRTGPAVPPFVPDRIIPVPSTNPDDRPEPDPIPDAPPKPPNPITSILDGFIKNNARSLLIIPPGSGVNSARQFSPAGISADHLPSDLLAMVSSGSPAHRRFIDQNGELRLALGIRINEHDAQYYELVSLTGLQETLSSLRNILFGVALAASALGAGLGYYSARRAVQPLTRVADAAQAIADGDFGTRLEPQIDPDLKRLTRSFNDMVAALQHRIQRDEQFASDVSHELRSPLMTLTASLGVLEGRRDDLSAPAQQAVDLLGKDLRRFQRLVEDLLEISRMDVGAVVLDTQPVFLQQFLQLVIAQSVTPDLPIRCRPVDQYLLVNADKRRLAQVITNLLDNANKYAGGAVAITFERHDDVVHIYVDDAGRGVPEADRIRIFDRFTRAGGDAGRRETAKGVGLGLSLVQEHIRLHNGRVWVTDRPDGRQGARFVIELRVNDTDMGAEEMAT